MGSVFDASTKIRRTVADPATDDTLPSSSALSWGGITSASGVAGTTGADCKLVNGDRWQEVSGTQTENINSNVLTTILGNETRTVKGSTTESYIGNVVKTISANYTRTIIGSELGLNVGPFNRTDVAPVTWLCPTASMLNSGDLYETKIFKGGAYALRSTQVGIDFATRVENAQVAIHSTNLTAVEAKLTATEGIVSTTNLTANSIRAGILAAWLNVAGIQGNTRPIQADVGCRVEAPPASLPGVE